MEQESDGRPGGLPMNEADKSSSPAVGIPDAIKHHADAILRASGSRLDYYTLPAARRAILSAVAEAMAAGCEQACDPAMAYRAWAEWTGDTFPDEPGTSILTLAQTIRRTAP